jgi:hypothetical protein
MSGPPVDPFARQYDCSLRSDDQPARVACSIAEQFLACVHTAAGNLLYIHVTECSFRRSQLVLSLDTPMITNDDLVLDK